MNRDMVTKELVDKIEAEAHGCEEKDIIRKSDGDGKYEQYMDYFKSYGIMLETEKKCVRPLPCVRDERGAIEKQNAKQLFQKINEELDELKEAYFNDVYSDGYHMSKEEWQMMISEEAADTITAITTLLEALGIDAEMRDEAQRRVNEKNRKRGRL